MPVVHAPHWRFATSEPASVCPWPAGHVRHATQASLPSVALKWPAAHVEHTRLDDALGAAVSYWPAAHVVMAWHTRSDVPVGAAKVYWPDGHVAECVAQVRSLLTLGTCVSHSFAVHSSTGVQASPLLAPEKSAASVQAAHSRSAIAVPAEVMPEPTAQVAQTLHALLPASVLNWPLAQSPHVRSAEAVAAVTSSSPAAHTALTGSQAAPLLTLE